MWWLWWFRGRAPSRKWAPAFPTTGIKHKRSAQSGFIPYRSRNWDSAHLCSTFCVPVANRSCTVLYSRNHASPNYTCRSDISADFPGRVPTNFAGSGHRNRPKRIVPRQYVHIFQRIKWARKPRRQEETGTLCNFYSLRWLYLLHPLLFSWLLRQAAVFGVWQMLQNSNTGEDPTLKFITNAWKMKGMKVTIISGALSSGWGPHLGELEFGEMWPWCVSS